METKTCTVCGATETRELLTVGIVEIESAGVKIYPNPTNSILNIELKNAITNGTLTLFDMSGKAILLQVIYGNPAQINMSQLPAGNYILRIIENGTKSTRLQVVKQ